MGNQTCRAKLESPESMFEFKKDVRELAQSSMGTEKEICQAKVEDSAPFKQALS